MDCTGLRRSPARHGAVLLSGVLLDTQIYLWSVTGDARLTYTARSAIVSNSRVYLSVASLWEIGIKSGLGKLDVDVPLARLVEEFPLLKGIDILPIEPRDILRLATLPHHHRDPFDRMIVAQALSEGLPLVSSDPALDAYGVRRVF